MAEDNEPIKTPARAFDHLTKSNLLLVHWLRIGIVVALFSSLVGAGVIYSALSEIHQKQIANREAVLKSQEENHQLLLTLLNLKDCNGGTTPIQQK